MASRWRTQTAQEINLAPLLDVIFCLLFFFILATSIKRENEALEVTLPKSEQGAAQPDTNQPLIVAIRENNEIFFRGRTLSANELEEALRAARTESPDAEQVLIRSDGRADVQIFMDVSDACARAGLKSAMMETQPRPSEEAATGELPDTNGAPERRRGARRSGE